MRSQRCTCVNFWRFSLDRCLRRIKPLAPSLQQLQQVVIPRVGQPRTSLFLSLSINTAPVLGRCAHHRRAARDVKPELSRRLARAYAA